ncbi:MAG: hypothetical protein VB089_01580 [Anaerolineaceae bacterium]|nr:hypothetical protein [Anaerolineaceae bacterium]
MKTLLWHTLLAREVSLAQWFIPVLTNGRPGPQPAAPPAALVSLPAGAPAVLLALGLACILFGLLATLPLWVDRDPRSPE